VQAGDSSDEVRNSINCVRKQERDAHKMGVQRELGHPYADLARRVILSSSAYPGISDDDDREMLEEAFRLDRMVSMEAKPHLGTSDVAPYIESAFDGSNVHVALAFQFQQ
jgi:hypothetical protein